MRNCQDVELLIQDYLEGYLLPSQREMLEEHVRSCAACRALVADMRRLDSSFSDVPSVDAPGDLGDRILDLVPPYPRRSLLHGIGIPRELTALAALFIIAVGIFLGARSGLLVPGEGREIEIAFHAPSAQSVAVVGDFNGWDATRHRMEKIGSGGVWRVRLKLKPGIYEYGFLIDGTDWSRDPGAERFLADGFGNENSILFVEG